jgi:hypothetical protein
LPHIKCAPWCEDGDGHASADHPDDQYCSAGFAEIELARHPEEIIKGSGQFYPRAVTLSLQRDPFADAFVSCSDAGHVEVTPAEARRSVST